MNPSLACRLAALNKLLPDEIVLAPSILKQYAGDKWFATHQPDAVARPRSTKSVAAILRFANRHAIPVTARGVSQSFCVVSAHLPPGDPGSTVDWDALARLGGTAVLLMAAPRLAACCAALVAGGRDAATPVAVVQDASLPTQRTFVTTLGEAAVAAALDVRAPAIVVVGEVVAMRLEAAL